MPTAPKPQLLSGRLEIENYILQFCFFSKYLPTRTTCRVGVNSKVVELVALYNFAAGRKSIGLMVEKL